MGFSDTGPRRISRKMSYDRFMPAGMQSPSLEMSGAAALGRCHHSMFLSSPLFPSDGPIGRDPRFCATYTSPTTWKVYAALPGTSQRQEAPMNAQLVRDGDFAANH